jgi:hypothetical protein
LVYVIIISVQKNEVEDIGGISDYLLLIVAIKDTGVLSAPVIALLV